MSTLDKKNHTILIQYNKRNTDLTKRTVYLKQHSTIIQKHMVSTNTFASTNIKNKYSNTEKKTRKNHIITLMPNNKFSLSVDISTNPNKNKLLFAPVPNNNFYADALTIPDKNNVLIENNKCVLDINKMFKQESYSKKIFNNSNILYTAPININKKFLYNTKNSTKNSFDIKIKKSLNIKIPKNIFRTFKYEYSDELKMSWLNNHPDFKYYFYNNAKCLEMIKENFSKDVYDTYMTMNAGAARSDLWRCCALYLYGGMYSDIDNRCLKNLEYILDDNDFVIPIDSCASKSFFFNAFISSTARNNILYHHINRIINNVKNKLYSDNTFAIAGPKAFGISISECLNNDINKKYVQGEINVRINKYIKHEVNFNNGNFVFPENTNNVISYNIISDSGYDYDTTPTYLKLNSIYDNKINFLHIGVNNESSFTIMEHFYFGIYNYVVSPSTTNIKIIEIIHNEYEKLKNNINSLEINFPINIINDCLNNDLFIFSIINYNKTTIKIKIMKINENTGWDTELKISIYYKSLKINTGDINTDESKFIVYDNLEYFRSDCVNIETIHTTNKYAVKNINANNFEIFLESYNYYLPEQTIISYSINNGLHPQEQRIKFLHHINNPDSIYSGKDKIIRSQVAQTEKNNISAHYASIISYNNTVIYSPETPKKIASICCNINFHKYINILLTSKLDIDYYISSESEWIRYFEIRYNIKFKQIELFDDINYDKIIYFNFEDIKKWYVPSDKLIILNLFYKNMSEYNKYQIIDTHKFNETKYNYITPVFKLIDIDEKNKVLINECALNIFFDGEINNDFFSKFLNISTQINIYTNVICNIEIKSKNINILYISEKENIINTLLKCHYYISFSNKIELDLLFVAFGLGCQLIVSNYKILAFDIKSALILGKHEIDFTKSVNLVYIFEDIDTHIKYNKKIIEYVINECKKDLF